MYTNVLSRWLFALLLLSCQALLGQTTPTIQWQRLYGGPAKQTANGDYLIAGGNVIRLASDGTQKWSKSLATYSADNILLLPSGNSAVLAHDSYYYFKWAVILLNPAGDIISTQPFETYIRPSNGYPQSNPFDIVQGSDGGIIVLGTVSYGREGSGTTVYKFGIDGSFIKQASIQHPLPPNQYRPNSIGNRILSLVDGYMVVGSAYGKGWAAKLNSSLDVIWSEQYSAAQSITDAIVSPFDSQAFVATGRNTDQTVTLTISPTNPSVNNTAITYRPSLQFATLNNYPYEGSQTNTYPLPRIVSTNANSYEVIDAIDQRSGDIRVTSFGAANQTHWTKLLGGSAADIVNNAITTQDGGYLLSGLTQSNDGDIQGNMPNNVSGWLVKLAPGTPLVVNQPSYDCDRGSITFITTGGDGSPITYSAPGVSRQSATSNTGFVEQGLRNDPKPIIITATQSGYSTSYVFDFRDYCTGIITPTLKEPIPDQSRPVNVQIVNNIIPINSYFNGVPSFKSFRPIVNYRASGLPPGLILFDSSNESQQLAYIGGTPTTTGTYSVTVTAYVSNAAAPQPSVSTTFRIAITDSQVVTPPPTGGTLTITQPTYNCSTGTITFNTTGGDGSPITFSAPGIMRSSVTSNTGTVEQGLRNDPKTITITATQSGQTNTYNFDLKAACSGTTPTPTPPATGNALSLSAYVGNCASQTPLIAFKTTGGDGTPITFSAPGVVRRFPTDSSGTIESGLRNDPKPITISALQSGKSVSYVVDLPKLCDPTPTVGTPIDNLTLTIGQRVDQTIVQSNYNFYDPYVSTDITGHYSRASSIRYSSTKLPDSLYAQNFTRGDDATYFRLFGQPTTTGVFPVTVTATVNGRSVSAMFTITILPANTQPTTPTPPATGNTLTLTAPTYNCSTGAFTFNYTGGDGSPVEFQAAGITGWTTNPNQFVDKDSRTANDVKPFTLMARQNGQVITYTWDLKATCGRSARMAATEVGQTLELTVKGNPVGTTAVVEIRGAEGRALQLDLLNASGHVLEQRHIEQAGAVDEQRFEVQRQPTGLLFLRAQSGQQKQTVKLIKQ